MKDIDGLLHSAFPTLGKAAEGAAKAAEGAAAAAAPTFGSGFGNALGGITGAVGNASKVGAVSVPASWTAAPAATPISVALNGAAGAAAAEPATAAFGGLPMVPGAGTGRSVANFAAPRYGFKPTVIAQPRPEGNRGPEDQGGTPSGPKRSGGFYVRFKDAVCASSARARRSTSSGMKSRIGLRSNAAWALRTATAICSRRRCR